MVLGEDVQPEKGLWLFLRPAGILFSRIIDPSSSLYNHKLACFPKEGLKHSSLPFVVFAVSKTSPKSTFISSERDTPGRKSHKRVGGISDKSMQETCPHLTQPSANSAVETLY